MRRTQFALLGPRARLGACIVLLAVAGAACSGGRRLAYSPEALRAEISPRLPAERRGELVVPFQPTPEMVARAKKYTDGSESEFSRAELLVRAVTLGSQFNVRYEPVVTTVASDTLKNGHGNCLSMSSLFVGLARGIGLSAYYVDASDRINDLSREDELIVDTGHIAATVRTERGWSLVDFTGEISSYRTFRVIDDLEALAHFYNNRGYERISAAQQRDEAIPWRRALADFSMAVTVKDGFARAHNNLGVARARLGDDDGALIAYKAAVQAESSFAAPHHNLGNLHLRRDEFDRAVYWYTLAIRLQKHNPFAHYHLGLAQYQAGDVAGSIESFERAIRLKQDYIEPRTLLARAYRAQGRAEDAQRVLDAIRQVRDKG